MKKLTCLFFAALALNCHGAGSYFSSYTPATSATNADDFLINVENYPGSYSTRRITFSNLVASIRLVTNAVFYGDGAGVTNIPFSSMTLVTNYLWVGAAAWNGVATNPPTVATYAPTGSDGSKLDVWAFDDTTSQSVEFICSLPSWNWTSFAAKVFWCSTNAGTTNVAWGLSMGSKTNGSGTGNTLGSVVYVTNANAGANMLNITSATPDIPVGGYATNGGLLKFHIARQTGITANLVGNALLKGVLLRYVSTNQPNW